MVRVGNGEAEDWRWDLNPGPAAIAASFWDHSALAEKNHGLLYLLLRYGTLDWAEGEGRTVHLWVF